MSWSGVLVEFTGERVVPDQVEIDLWNEHLSRYAFARLFARSKFVLDVGCGTGYGSAELAADASGVIAVDVAADALEYARHAYPLGNLTFAAADCLALPFPNASFDLVVAFEVIEHLGAYRGFLWEVHRVLKPDGVLLVSTPNKLYYAESRGQTGPNPYHVHEFEFSEFKNELEAVFAHAGILLQNRTECFAFYPPKTFLPSAAAIESSAGPAEGAHFFIGLCSASPLPPVNSFVWVPRAANLLKERELHIQALETQLSARTGERDELLRLLRREQALAEELTRWAQGLESELDVRTQAVVALQRELERVELKVAELAEENRAKTAWALDIEDRMGKEAEKRGAELAECARLLQAAEEMVVERTHWAQSLDRQRAELESRLNAARASRWLRLGKVLGLGPRIEES